MGEGLMPFVTQHPAGGYMVTRDDGSSFLSAMPPPGLSMQGGAPESAPPPPTVLNPAIAAAAHCYQWASYLTAAKLMTPKNRCYCVAEECGSCQCVYH